MIENSIIGSPKKHNSDKDFELMNKTLDSTLKKHKPIATVEDYKENISLSHKICNDVIRESNNRTRVVPQRHMIYEDNEFDNDNNKYYKTVPLTPSKVY